MNDALNCDALRPVSLEELVAEAALLTRVDRKYLLPLGAAARVLAELDESTRVLEIDGRRSFAYDSVYFDTSERTSYRLTAQRRRRRFKLRTRSYLDTGGAYLELKTKSGRGATVKERFPCTADARARLDRQQRSRVEMMLAERGHDPELVPRLQPALVSRYRRTTLLLGDGSRATIDAELQWSDPAGRAIALPSYAIIESKSTGGPSPLDRSLWRSGQRPSGISKFGTGTAALYPELPGNKWARALRGPFSSSISIPPLAIAAAISPAQDSTSITS
ncbi:polyphosphate polymerase domain-containing protein [Leucobacter sp. USHLN153]|uniref:polyphosphate polymerase domain-containing protein n=1 Tax=Leucobacter sp. USHLN153 TaxID=3081268 RepID=UPI003016E8E5